MERLRPLILTWLQKPGNTRRNLSALSGVPERRIYSILRGYDPTHGGGRSTHVEFTTADRLLGAMDMYDVWWNELYDLYEVA